MCQSHEFLTAISCMYRQDDEKEELMENTAHQFLKEPKLCDMQDKLENKRRGIYVHIPNVV